MCAEGVRLKILFLGLSYADVAHESSLYTELVEELSKADSDIQVVAPALDTSHKGPREEGDISVLRVATGKLFGVNLFQKALNNLLLPIRYFFALHITT